MWCPAAFDFIELLAAPFTSDLHFLLYDAYRAVKRARSTSWRFYFYGARRHGAIEHSQYQPSTGQLFLTGVSTQANAGVKGH